jgi:WD40 repeat protein
LQKAGSTCTSEGINIFALNRGTTFPGVMVSGMAQRIQAIQFAPDGRQVAAATEHGITIWNVADNTVAHWLAVPDRKDFMQRLWYSPDGALLLAYDERANLYFWQTSDGTLLHTIPNLPLDRLTFSPDGTLMAILAQGEITLWGIQP